MLNSCLPADNQTRRAEETLLLTPSILIWDFPTLFDDTEG